ncbi:MAG: hypothetical protein AAGG08_14635, partial [Actinomycetota bacterium]
RFVHDLFHDVLLDGLDDETRAELALVALRDPIFDDDAESRRRSMLARIAVHDDPMRAIDETIAAADLEVERRHPVEAERLLRRATDLIERHGDPNSAASIASSITLGSVAMSNGRDDAAAVLLDAADRARRLGRADLATAALMEASRIGPSSNVGTSDTDVERSITATRALPTTPADRVRLDIAEMSVFGIGTDGQRARELLDSGLRTAHESGDPELITLASRSAYMAVLRPEDLAARRTIAADLGRRAHETDDVSLRYESIRLDFSIAIEAGESDPRPLLTEMRELHEHFNERTRNWSLFAFCCAVGFLDGDEAAMQEHIELILSPESAVSEALQLATAGGHQVALHLLRGDLEVLDPLVAELETSVAQLKVWTATRAATAAAAGDADTAIDRLRRATNDDGTFDLADDFTAVPAAFLLGEAALRVEDEVGLGIARERLARHRGLWIWYGTGTFGPVDLALARWDAATGANPIDVHEAATSALRSASVVGSPHLVAAAAQVIAATPRSDGHRTDGPDTDARLGDDLDGSGHP